MKKFLLGCFMFLGGIVGFVGWMTACATLKGGGIRNVFGALSSTTDHAMVILFAIMAVGGFVLAISEIKKD